MGHIVRILGIDDMFKLSLLVAALILLNAKCYGASSENTAVNVTEARARLDQGSVSLSGNFLQYLVSKQLDENSVASATSLLIPLAEIGLFAIKPVLEELLKLLNLNSKDEIKAVFPELNEDLDVLTQVVSEITNKYFTSLQYAFSKYFIEFSLQTFHVGGGNIDFSENSEAADTINDWVSNHTDGKIQNLVKADMFNADTRLCLVNAIYFLGNWVHQFNPNDTEVKDFYKSNGETVPLKIMYQQNTFHYTETDKYQVLEMFYKGNNFSFVVVLPRNKEDLLPTLTTFGDPDEWNKMMASLGPEKVQVNLPKMLINTKTYINKMLMKYGFNQMFDSRNNGFEGILETPEPMYITDAVQKDFVSVDETGTEAAAATAIALTYLAVQNPLPEIYIFEANRPFIFYIMFGKIPLFCGLFVGAQ